MDIEELRKKRQKLKQNTDDIFDNMQTISDESLRVADVAHNSEKILSNLDEEFENKTGLTKTDTAFLFLAIGLQIARQYVFSNEKFRLDSKQGDELVDKLLSLTPPTWQEVLTQSVPYDAIVTGKHVSNTGLSGTTHRYRTLGHDPILGWVFGTANIMTNSLTKTDLETFQVNMKTKKIVRHYPLGFLGMLTQAVENAKDDPILLAASVARQAIHFGSDYFTKQGLPIPLIATVDNNLAQKMLSKWHIDMYSISRGITLSTFINTLITIIHSLFYNGETEMDQKLYEVRTRKIIMYSNAVATSTNIAVVALTKDLSKLDIGGMGVTIYRLITDSEFIRNVKEEFVFGGFNKLIQGEELKLKEIESWV